LTFEAERLEKKGDQQTRTESKTRLVEQINLCLHASDYSRVLHLLQDAAAEFPNDAELSELEKLAQDGVKRNAEAQRLITESQEQFAERKSAEAIQLLRRAYELDENNALARSILANALVEHAYSIVETDWWEAETLANEALALNPAHPTAKTIHSRILDQKTTGSVEDWVAQARKLQSSGNLSAALSQIAEGFAVFPHEPRLLQIQDAIQRDHSTQRRQARRRDLEDLRRTASEVDGVADVAARKALAERIRAVTVKYSTDGEILSIANALLLRLGQLGVAQKSSTASPDSESATRMDHGPAPIAPEVLRAATSQVSPNWIPPENTRTVKVLPRTIPPSEVVPSQIPSSKAPPSIVPPVAIPPSRVPATPLEPHLAPPPAATEPSVPAAKASSQPSQRTSQAKHPTRSNSTTLTLVSAAAIILVVAIFFFARRHPAPPEAQTLAPAPTISAPTVAAPAVPAPAVSAPDAAVPIISAPTVAVPTASAPSPATPEPSPPAARLSPDTGTGKVPLDSGHNLGTLVVVAGQDNASVFLNGKLQPQLTQSGQLRLPNLELKDYVVQVSKSGFQDPPQQKIRIRNGEPARLVFNLLPQPQPQPRLASLTIQGGTPGTTVLVDQTPVGTIQPDGTFSVSTVNPGDHTVELRKDRFKSRQFKKHFVVGTAISLAAADAALEAAPGELRITFAPADANVAIVKAGELPTRVSSGVPLNLAAGTYTLTARTAEMFTRSSTLEVVAGQSKTLDLSLAPSGMSKWEDPAAWKHEGESFIHKGGDFVLYGVVPASGTLAFSAMPTKGRILQWVLNYTDPKNYVLFQIDENNFYRTVIRNGEKTDEIIVPDKGDKKTFRTLHIRVSPTEIVHQIRHGDSWKVLDRCTQPGANLSQGKFGFYIPGSDEVALSGFAHYVDLNLR
jgi:tetratricopeptide (TPR) repeat protein